MTHLVVVGATGDVGRGVVASALELGWSVSAAGRTLARLQALAAATDPNRVDVVAGSVASPDQAKQLARRLKIGHDSSVVVAVSTPWSPTSGERLDWSDVSVYLDSYLGAHMAAAQAFVPSLAPGSSYVAIGGGMADFVPSGMIPVSMAQAAQRMLMRGLAKDYRSTAVLIRELLVVSQVSGASNRSTSDPTWLTDEEVGRHVCQMIASPEDFEGPIHELRPSK